MNTVLYCKDAPYGRNQGQTYKMEYTPEEMLTEFNTLERAILLEGLPLVRPSRQGDTTIVNATAMALKALA